MNGGTIVATDDATAATLDHAALTTTTHKVDIISELVSNFGQTEASTTVTISATSQTELKFDTWEKTTAGSSSTRWSWTSSRPPKLWRSRLSSTCLALVSIMNQPLLLGTFTGSVKTAGRQTFTLDEGDVGDLHEILRVLA